MPEYPQDSTTVPVEGSAISKFGADREEQRAKIRPAIEVRVVSRGISKKVLGLDPKKWEVLLDAAADSVVVEETGRTETEKIINRGNHKEPLDPVAIRHLVWFKNAGFSDDQSMLALKAIGEIPPPKQTSLPVEIRKEITKEVLALHGMSIYTLDITGDQWEIFLKAAEDIMAVEKRGRARTERVTSYEDPLITRYTSWFNKEEKTKLSNPEKILGELKKLAPSLFLEERAKAA